MRPITRGTMVASLLGMLSMWLAGGSIAAAQETAEPQDVIVRLELPFPDLAALTIFMARPRQLNENGHPFIIYFEGGGQEEKYAKNIMYSHLAREARKRGYIFLSPAAPCRTCTFSAKGDRYFPALFEMLAEHLPVKDRKFHLMGYSNGGRSSLHLGSLHPDWVASITTLPGMLEEPSKEALARLATLCISMHVGRKDARFLAGQRRLVRILRRFDREIHAVEHAGQRHWIERLATADGANWLLDDIENGVGCPG